MHALLHSQKTRYCKGGKLLGGQAEYAAGGLKGTPSERQMNLLLIPNPSSHQETTGGQSGRKHPARNEDLPAFMVKRPLKRRRGN